MLRLRGQMSVEIHVVAHSEAGQPGVFNYIHEKLKISTTVGQVAQWLEDWTRKRMGARKRGFEPQPDLFFLIPFRTFGGLSFVRVQSAVIQIRI